MAALIFTMPFVSVYAQVELPDIHQITKVEVYRHVIEENDSLYLINYDLEYGTLPGERIDDTYLFRLVDPGTGILGSTTAYGFFDDGYSQGIASIYFSAEDAPTWNGAYTMYFDGNPSLHWFGETATTAMEGAVADDGGAQTDETVAANSAAANDMTLLPLAPAVNDAYYFGSNRMFTILTLNIGTAGTPAYNPGVAGWLGAWEYYDGDSWETVSTIVDGTVGFTTAVGNHDVTYDLPDNWNATNVNGINAYWLRYRITEFNTLLAQPLGTQSWTNTVDPPTVNTASFSWFDEGSVSAAQERLTTRLRTIATILENEWGGAPSYDLIEETASGKVFTVLGEEYFTNCIINLRLMCASLFYQQMSAVEYEHDILVTERLSTGADDVEWIYNLVWGGQTFIPREQYDINGVNICVNRKGLPGTITASVRETAGGLPTGADLAVGTYDGDTIRSAEEIAPGVAVYPAYLISSTGGVGSYLIGTGAGGVPLLGGSGITGQIGEWISIPFTTDYTLNAGTSYAIVVRAATGDMNNRLNWLEDNDNGYANGQKCLSPDSGVTWGGYPLDDMLFEIMARGGMTPRSDRVEGRLEGTIFDLSNWAANWGTSTMWISTLMWIGMIFVLCWAVALATNSWDCTMLIIAICTAYGWRSGFVDSVFMAIMLAILALGIVYAMFWKKSY